MHGMISNNVPEFSCHNSYCTTYIVQTLLMTKLKQLNIDNIYVYRKLRSTPKDFLQAAENSNSDKALVPIIITTVITVK